MIGASAEAWYVTACERTPNQCASSQAPKNYYLECFVQAFYVVDKLDTMFYFPLNSSSYIPGLLPETEQTMNTFEEKTMTSLQSLFAKVDTLSRFNIRDILKPDVYDHYEQTLQEAYDALIEVEDALTTLGMKLEYQHFRLGGAVDELKPLMIQPHAPSDRIMEVFERRLS
jgi:hypothetical protein